MKHYFYSLKGMLMSGAACLMFSAAMAQTSDTTYTGTVERKQTVGIVEGGISPETTFEIRNTGPAKLKFCLSELNASDCTPQLPDVTLATGETKTITAAEMNYLETKQYLNVTNTSELQKGAYTVRLNLGDGGFGDDPECQPTSDFQYDFNLPGESNTGTLVPVIAKWKTGDRLLYACPFDTKVGIGTDNPLAKLHVVGNSIIAGKMGIGTTAPSQQLNVYNAGVGQTNILIGNPNTSTGGYTSLTMGISANANGYSHIQSIKSAGSAWGALAINGSGGHVGIGTTTPGAPLEVKGIFRLTQDAGGYLQLGAYTSSDNFGYVTASGQKSGTGLKFQTSPAGGNWGVTHMTITNTGNIGIGTENPANKLDVCGTIRAKEVIVDPGNWCDFVFNKDYRLPTISERKAFIEEYSHLPYMKPEKEILKNGAKLSEAVTGILQNVEEHELYIHQHEEKINAQQKEIDALKTALDKALQEIEAIKIRNEN